LNMYSGYKSCNSELFLIHLNDGTIMFNDECHDVIMFDINGEKGPNEYGRDIFDFYIITGVESYKQMNYLSHFNTKSYHRLLNEDSSDWISSDRDDMKSNCKNKQLGWSCTALLESDGWEFKDDYPYRL